MSRPTLFFDSGVGGIPYLDHLRNKFKNENYIYIADNENFPYGEKSKDFLVRIVSEIIKIAIKKFNPKVIIVACNTASVNTLDNLRAITNIPIIGVVPAIKTAALKSKNKRIGILATKRTVEGQYIKDLIMEFCPNYEILLVGATGIVEFVEKKLFNASELAKNSLIKHEVDSLIKYNVDCVVLGCTHFIHVENEIKQILGVDINVIDSRDGVINQAIRVSTYNNSTKNGVTLFYVTSDNKEDFKRYNYFCNKFSMEYKGEL